MHVIAAMCLKFVCVWNIKLYRPILYLLKVKGNYDSEIITIDKIL